VTPAGIFVPADSRVKTPADLAGVEPPLVTVGDDAVRVVRALAGRSGVWSAADVVSYLLAGTNPA